MVYKLIYFDGRGTAERIRMLFKIARTDFEDVRLNRDSLKQMQGDGTLACSMGKVPVLDVDGTKIPQSKAIERYVAKQLGMMGASPVEEAQIDAVLEHQRDLRDAYKKVDDMPSGDDKTEKYKEFFAQTMPAFMSKVEAALSPSAGPFLVGSTVTVADVAWYQFLLDYLDGGGWEGEKEAVAEVLSKMPRIKCSVYAVLAIPEIAAWLKDRPAGMF